MKKERFFLITVPRRLVDRYGFIQQWILGHKRMRYLKYRDKKINTCFFSCDFEQREYETVKHIKERLIDRHPGYDRSIKVEEITEERMLLLTGLYELQEPKCSTMNKQNMKH